MTGFISFHDDRKFIRVTDKQTNVVAYVHKDSLTIQRDNVSCFFIKSNTYIRYFKYTEILYPVTKSLEDLLTLLITLCTTEITSQVAVLNEIETGETVFTIDVQDKNEFMVDESTSNNAFSTYQNRAVTMSLSNILAQQTNSIVRQSKQYIHTPPGKASITMISGTLLRDNTLTSASNLINKNLITTENHVKSRIGVFDDSDYVSPELNDKVQHGNGVYFEYYSQSNAEEYSNLSVVLRKNNQVTEQIYQTDWNIDPMNGKGASGRVLRIGEQNSFVLKCGNLPNTKISVGCMNHGSVIIVHEFDVEEEDFNWYSKLPVRWELSQKNDSANEITDSPYELIQNRAVVISNESYYAEKKYVSTITTPFTKISSVADKNVLFEIKLHDNHIRSKLKLLKINIINVYEGTSVLYWKIVKNGTLHYYDWETSITYDINGYEQSTTTRKHNHPSDTDSIINVNDIAGDYIPKLQKKSKASIFFAESSIDSNNDTSNYITVENGEVVASGYIAQNSLTEIDLTNQMNVLFANIAGYSDRLALLVEYINSPAELQANITWEEYE